MGPVADCVAHSGSSSGYEDHQPQMSIDDLMAMHALIEDEEEDD
jgi:hypothetical protein